VRGRSGIQFLHARTGEALDALASAQITASSSALGWADVHVEVGRNAAWDVDDIVVPKHYLALNTDRAPLVFEAKTDARFRRTVLAPGETWFCPARESFSHRVSTPAAFVLVTFDPTRLLRTVNDDRIELSKTYGLHKPQLEHLVRALAAEAERGGPSGAMFVDALTVALAVQLVDSFGTRHSPPAAESVRLSKTALRRVLEQIDGELGSVINVERLAVTAGLGAATFARAFKAATGETPHQFVMRRRLEEGRKALELREPDILNVALRLGFSDQAHFTRLFKRQFGVPPGRFVRERSMTRIQ
jgi:AraC family transcriptional regulator